MNRPWQDSPTVCTVEEILKKVSKCTKWLIGLLIATVLGIIAVATIAAAAGAALHQSVQTAQFVQEWQKDSDGLWSIQRQIDGKSAAPMADLQQVFILPGDQVNSLQKQTRLKYDWNISSFRVTPHKYSESSFHWDKVKQHLLNQGKLSRGSNSLQQKIMETLSQKLHLVQRSNLQEAAADGISHLNPTPPLETIRGSMVGFMLIFMCHFFCFYIVWQQITKKVNRQQQQLATIALASMINNNHQK